MAAKDQLVLCLRALSLRSSSTPSQSTRCFSSTSIDRASTVQQRRRHHDPYAIAQARARKAANLSRQEVLQKQRAAALGDPVRGVTTPFVQSFDTAVPQSPPTATSNDATTSRQTPSGPDALNEQYLNYFLKQKELQNAIDRTEKLLAPTVPREVDTTDLTGSEQDIVNQERRRYEATRRAFEQDHANSTEALRRIASLANASSKDRLKVNIQRCIDTFGRHKTDKTLPPKAPSAAATLAQTRMKKIPRAGPDTGSSEVQAAILTAKIRTLADFLDTRGKGDKANKRNLRLLVHKRQKLLNYLKRKERGGPRWQNLIETLGLTPGTYEGEISM
ncbi:hypothetical protein MBLNU457_4610t1 [Dothideomycetes sp. NU457]